MSESRDVVVKYHFSCSVCPLGMSMTQGYVREPFLRKLEEHLDNQVMHDINISTTVSFKRP